MISTVIAGSQRPELNEALAAWIVSRLGHVRMPRPPYSTMGIFDGSTLIGALIFENYVPEYGTVEIGIASISPRWMSRAVMRRIGEFVTDDLGCQMAMFRTSEDNPVCRMLKRVGMQCIVIPRGRGSDQNEHMYLMTREEWEISRLNRPRVAHAESSSPA